MRALCPLVLAEVSVTLFSALMVACKVVHVASAACTKFWHLTFILKAHKVPIGYLLVVKLTVVSLDQCQLDREFESKKKTQICF